MLGRVHGLVVVLGLVATVASVTTAHAQRRRGNQDQQAPTTGEKPVQKEEKKFPLGQSWIAVSFNNKSLSGAERPYFSLDEQFRVRGFSGCNDFQATAYPLREQGIAVGPLALTKRNCDKGLQATEQAFLTALRTSSKWETVVGSLILKGPNGEIKFERSL